MYFIKFLLVISFIYYVKIHSLKKIVILFRKKKEFDFLLKLYFWIFYKIEIKQPNLLKKKIIRNA